MVKSCLRPGSQAAKGLLACLGASVALGAGVAPAAAQSAEQVTASPAVTGHLGGPGRFSISVEITSALGGVPAPLSQLLIDLPPGPIYNFASLPTCSRATIAAATHAAPACPDGSQFGAGTATVQATFGSSLLTETATMDLYLTQRSPPAFEVWANATTPVAETLAFPGTFTSAAAPYGEQVSVSIPPISTVPGGPDGSVVALSFAAGGARAVSTTTTIRRAKRTITRRRRTVVSLFTLPRGCPRALPYAVTATLADGTAPSATGTLTCP